MSREAVAVTGAEEYPVFESFDDYDLHENLLRGIYSYGFEKPSAIQQRGIKPILDGRDTIGQARAASQWLPLWPSVTARSFPTVV